MKEAAIWILCIYSLIQGFIIWYFLIYKSDQADKEYERRLKEIYDRKR